MQTQTPLNQGPQMGSPRYKQLSESQLHTTLSSSIEDLLQKISKVTNDYDSSPPPTQPISTKAISIVDRLPQETKMKKVSSFQQTSYQQSVSSTGSGSDHAHSQKQNWDHCYHEESPFFTTHSHKVHPPQAARPKIEIVYGSNSLKVIRENQRQQQKPKLSKLNSLFQDPGIRQVCQSKIMNQKQEGSCGALEEAITKGLKSSIITEEPKKVEPGRKIKLSDFELGKQVGSGKFGDVYLCKHKQTGSLFALKKIFKSVIRQYKIESQFALQLKILYTLDHPNIVKLYAHFDDEYHIFLLMEYVQGGQLLKKLGSSQAYVAQTITQMLDAVDYIHSKGVVHRDIKPQNIVVSFDRTVKLVDFGWAGFFDFNQMKTTFCGTLDYVSPQMKDKGQYSSKVDLWSLGVLTFELLTKEAPFKGEIANWKRRGGHRKEQWDWHIIYPPQISGLAQSFMRNLLKENPQDRASLRYCKNHFFIRKYKEADGMNFPLPL